MAHPTAATDRALRERQFSLESTTAQSAVSRRRLFASCLSHALGSTALENGPKTAGMARPRRLTQFELDQFAAVHGGWLQGDPSAAPVDLSGCDLRSLTLRGIYLCGANLANADLRGMLIEDSDLSHCSFAGADLSDACIIRTDLTSANLMGARLIGTVIDAKHQRLDRAFRGTLAHANFARTDLTGARIRAPLDGAQFSRARLCDTDFTGSVIHEEAASFFYTDLGRVKALSIDLRAPATS